jgi:hypothetical protein
MSRIVKFAMANRQAKISHGAWDDLNASNNMMLIRNRKDQ